MLANDNQGKTYNELVADVTAKWPEIQAVIENTKYPEDFRDRGREVLRKDREYLEGLRKKYAPKDPSFIIREV